MNFEIFDETSFFRYVYVTKIGCFGENLENAGRHPTVLYMKKMHLSEGYKPISDVFGESSYFWKYTKNSCVEPLLPYLG